MLRLKDRLNALLKRPILKHPLISGIIVLALSALGTWLFSFMTQKPSQQPTIINQTTSGPGSPAVGQAGGNVTITNEQPSTPKNK